MPYFDKISIDSVSYDVHDSGARELINDIKTLSGIFDVTKFGADNTGTAYCDTVVSSVMAANSGGIIYFPPGRYRFASPIIISKPYSLYGAFCFGNFEKTDSAGSILQFDQDGIYIRYGGIEVKGLAIVWGSTSSGSSGNAIGIDIQSTTSAENVPTFLKLENLFIQDFRFGINLETANTTYMSSFKSIWVNGGDTAYRIRPATGGNTTSMCFINCWGTWQTNVTFNLVNAYYTALISCGSDNSQFGYALEGCIGLKMMACGVEATTGTSTPAARLTNCNACTIQLFGHNTGGPSFVSLVSCSGVALDVYNNDTAATSVTDDGSGASRNSFVGYCRGSVTISGETFTPDGFIRYLTNKQGV